MSMIEDGKGTGQRAEVDDHGRLYVRANTVGHMSHHATFHKNAYLATFETTLVDGSLTPVALFQNATNDKDYEVYWVFFSSNAAVETAIYLRSGFISGGEVINSFNTNLSASASGNGDHYQGGASADLVVDTSKEQCIFPAFNPAGIPGFYNLEGGIVCTPGTSLSLKATGAAGNKIKVTVGYALHDTGTKL